MKLPLELLDKVTAAAPFSSDEILDLRRRGASDSPVDLNGLEHVELRKEMIADTAVENLDDAFERYIGNNDLLPINYLRVGYLQSRSVGLIRYFDKNVGKEAAATGFLVGENLLLTNHHVFPVANLA